jgi:hypothetical protein
VWNVGLRVAGAMRGRVAATQAETAAREDAASREDDRTPQRRERYRQAFLALRDTLNGRRLPFTLAAYPLYWTVSGKKAPEQIN